MELCLEQFEVPNENISLKLEVRNELKALTQMRVQRASTKSQRQALLQLNIRLQMKTLRKDFLESSLALKTILRMFHKWPKIREFSLASVHHSSQGCVGSQKAHGHELPILIILTALFACFSPKISLGHTFPLSCQHPRTRGKFHTYIGRKDKSAMTILTERQFT